jgi:hypothetical protein
MVSPRLGLPTEWDGGPNAVGVIDPASGHSPTIPPSPPCYGRTTLRAQLANSCALFFGA